MRDVKVGIGYEKGDERKTRGKISKLGDVAYPREISWSQRIRGGDKLARRRGEGKSSAGISIFEVNNTASRRRPPLNDSPASFNDVPLAPSTTLPIPFHTESLELWGRPMDHSDEGIKRCAFFFFVPACVSVYYFRKPCSFRRCSRCDIVSVWCSNRGGIVRVFSPTRVHTEREGGGGRFIVVGVARCGWRVVECLPRVDLDTVIPYRYSARVFLWSFKKNIGVYVVYIYF